LREFIAKWADMWSRDGPLTRIGLVANPADQAARSLAAVNGFPALTAAELQ
jgi:phosphate transport system substrate-binding protein